MKPILGVDFDGTLAIQEDPYDPKSTGPPVAKMLLKVRREMARGRKVWIFTSRVNTLTHTPQQIKATKRLLGKFCKKWLGKIIPITAEKHPEMEIWDNSVRQVRTNKGSFVTEEIMGTIRAAWRTKS